MQVDERTSRADIESNRRVLSAVREIIDFIKPTARCQCDTWVEGNVNLKHDKSAAKNTLVDLDLTPHLREPLNFWSRNQAGMRKMTIMAIEQTGKSCVWIWGLLFHMVMSRIPVLMIHKSDDDAKDFNSDRFEPLMKGIKKLAQQLLRPKARRKDRYDFSDMLVYFMGGGQDIVGKPAGVTIADEPESWPAKADHVLKQFEDMEKRSRTFEEAMRICVCSPRKGGPVIGKDFKKSSQGFWHLRCQNDDCREWSIRSCDIHHLQKGELTAEENIIEENIRLICPECGHEHIEKQKFKMCLEGKYIHKFPERVKDHVGYQWGALAATFQSALSWKIILEKQLEAGKSANIEIQESFWNSFRGLPFEPKRANSKQVEAIQSHCDAMPDPACLENIFLIADTQDYGWKWAIRGPDSDNNHYMIAKGFVEHLWLNDDERARINDQRRAEAEDEDIDFVPVMTLEDVWNGHYTSLEIQPIMGLIDEGGHRKREVAEFVAAHEGIYAYKGDHRSPHKWRWSEEQTDLILAHAREYQSDLLYYVYVQHNRSNNYWYLPPEIDHDYVDEVAAFREQPKIKDGRRFENWQHNDRVHDFFDIEKMYFVMLDVACDILALEYWRHGKLSQLAPLREAQEAAEEAQKEQAQRPVQSMTNFSSAAGVI